MPSESHPTARRAVTLIAGDGIGPEVTAAARAIVDASGAPIDWEVRLAGATVFKQGLATGLPQETIESIKRTRVVLKGPLETPVGFGEASANVTIRKLFELYANIRPVRELPGVPTPFTGRGIDLVVVRENVEDLYAGIEYMQTPGVAQCLKLMSHKGSEKIVRLAFEVARADGRRKVHCATKANIMKMTEGGMKRAFEQVAPEYPDIEARHIIIDNCAHQLVRYPEQFDVIVTSNMNGDILSDLTSGLVGGLGFAPSANLGNELAMFEAVHGSAPDIAGRNLANPTAVVLSAIMMLRHMGLFNQAEAIEHALEVTLEEGCARTGDIVGVKRDEAASTTRFTETVIGNLGRRSSKLKLRTYRPVRLPSVTAAPDMVQAKSRRLVGVDVFVDSALSAMELGRSLEQLTETAPLKLKIIANRGVRVYPPSGGQADCVDHWRCRFVSRNGSASGGGGGDVTDAEVIGIIERIGAQHRWVHIEKLHEFDGKPGFTKAQGEE